MPDLFGQDTSLQERDRLDPELVVERKTDFILHKRAEDTIAEIVTGIAKVQSSRVSRSHLIRAVCILLDHASDEIIQEARAINLGGRPPNGAHMARHKYEMELAAVMSRAFKLRGPFNGKR